MSINETKTGTSCDQSYEDENSSLQSNVSQSVLEETPIRVRDMINLYNFATQKNQELEVAKSLYFGEKEQATKEQDCCEATDDGQASISCNCQHNNEAVNFRMTTSEDQTSLRQTLGGDATNGEEYAKSYESKTTIRRSKHGVRIIIDIFFDKNDNDIDIAGSRVETEIPRSRILTEFQQQQRSQQDNNSKPTTTPPNV